jgi:hypothetical protein
VEPRQIGGGILAAIAVIVQVVVQMADLTRSEMWAMAILVGCVLTASIGIGLIFWPAQKPSA